MIGALVLLIFLFLVTQAIFNGFERKHGFFSKKLMNTLFFYHLFFAIVYYTYALFNPSDSKKYFERPQYDGWAWTDYFGTSTTFIDFLSYPFINFLGFNYEMMMLLYAYMGFLGFVYAYLFFRENIPIKIEVFKVDLLVLLMFLPNMHFWTASLGKGAPIFLGLMMYAYALKDAKSRWFTLTLGSALIYFIRPHVFLFVAVGTILGYLTGREQISLSRKLMITSVMIIGLVLAKDTILQMAGLDGSGDIIQEFENFSETRSSELSKSTSGVDMASYPLPLKLFTFWFRPLFFDAPGFLGIIVSFENLIYLLLFFKILKKDFISFIRKSPISVKMSLTVFFLSSLALTFVMANLGIIMRQKSMVMYFLFFVIFYYLAQQKYDRIMKLRRLKKAKEEALKAEAC
ncbi:hypothetical protein [Salinimicrobium gaetbulicola]|uniref:EpsG-like glucosyltransferase n=1 Tax=Salinimicrobium gaetbulicola TaxID=999702 RepID=A0ABW3ICF9_9FLAO